MGNSKKFRQKYKICKLLIVYHFNIYVLFNKLNKSLLTKLNNTK